MLRILLFFLATFMLVCTGLNLYLGMSGDLWLDEIWSLRLVENLQSPWQLLALTHDNNHVLNSLQLWLWGAGKKDFLYRIVPTIYTVLSLGVLCLRKERRLVGGVAALALFGGSFFFIVLGTEARGYSGAILCAVLSFHLISRRQYFWTPLLHVAGMLFHSSYLCYLLALILSDVAYAFSIGCPMLRILKRVFRHFSVSLGFAVVWMGVFAFRMQIGGLDSQPLWVLGSRLLAESAGFQGTGQLLILICFVPLLAWSLKAERGELRFFYLFQWVGVPLLIIALRDSRFLAVRYFWYVPLFAIQLLIEYLTSARSRFALLFGTSLAFLLWMGNSRLLEDFSENGRGHYKRALDYLVRHAPPGRVALTSDHDFRNRMLLDYHRRFVPGTERIDYQSTSHAQRSFGEVDWLLAHSPRAEDVPRSELRLSSWEGPVLFRLVHVEKSAPLSGQQWWIYEKVHG